MIRLASIGEHSLIWQNRRFYWVLNEQLWFWSDEWQAGERQSEADYTAGRYYKFDNVDDFIRALDDEDFAIQHAATRDFLEFEKKE